MTQRPLHAAPILQCTYSVCHPSTRQVPLVDGDGVSVQLDDVRGKLADTSGLGEGIAKVVNILAKNAQVYHPQDQGRETWLKRPEVAALIKALPAIPDPDRILKTVLSFEDEAKLREIVEGLLANYEAALKKGSRESMLQHPFYLRALF